MLYIILRALRYVSVRRITDANDQTIPLQERTWTVKAHVQFRDIVATRRGWRTRQRVACGRWVPLPVLSPQPATRVVRYNVDHKRSTTNIQKESRRACPFPFILPFPTSKRARSGPVQEAESRDVLNRGSRYMSDEELALLETTLLLVQSCRMSIEEARQNPSWSLVNAILDFGHSSVSKPRPSISDDVGTWPCNIASM